MINIQIQILMAFLEFNTGTNDVCIREKMSI